MNLNEEQSEALKSIINGENVFLSGPGGVGKSVLVREIQKRFDDSTVFLAPTGIAALNINGATIHSTFKFPFSILTKDDWSNISPKTRELFDKNGPVKRIVIDEISMVRADVFQAIDQQLRRIRRLKHSPFGGLQIIVVGDFFQLPPVVNNQEKNIFNKFYDSTFAFVGPSWSEANFKYIGLDKIMRQSDAEFITHLMNVREKRPQYRKSIDFFNEFACDKKLTQVLDEDPVILCSTNKSANFINQENYQELETEEFAYQGTRTGTFRYLPVEEEVLLKYGTKIICIANTEKFKNGEIGYVINLFRNSVEIMMESDERKVIIDKHKWEECEYGISSEGKLSRNVIGSYVQLPLKYAWGITIHKAQGQTLSNGVIDIGNGAFSHGQVYVALSRVKTLEGLALFKKLSYSDVIVDNEVKEFYENGCRGDSLF